MKNFFLSCLSVLLFSGVLNAGLSVGRPSAVKKQVSKLDVKVREEKERVSRVNNPPVISSITVRSSTVAAGGVAYVAVSASDPDGDNLSYVWTSTAGTVSSSGSSMRWLAPTSPGVYTLQCSVSDGKASALTTTPITAVVPGTLKWVFDTSDVVVAGPAAGPGGVVYFGTLFKHFYAINPDGTVKWDYPLPNDIAFGPVIGGDGTVYVVLGDSALYAINADGTDKWGPSPELSSKPSETPTLGRDGNIYVLDGYFQLHAISEETGLGSSTFTEISDIRSSPVAGPDGTLYLLDGGGLMHIVPPAGISASTTADVQDIAMSPVIAADGTVYVVRGSTSVYSLNSDGSAKWGPLGTPTQISVPLAAGPDSALYALDDDLSLYKAAPAEGGMNTFAPLLSNVSYGPVVGPDGTVYAVNDGTGLYGLTSVGTLKWGPVSPDEGAGIYAAPVVADDGTVYFSDDSGRVYAVYSTSALSGS